MKNVNRPDTVSGHGTGKSHGREHQLQEDEAGTWQTELFLNHVPRDSHAPIMGEANDNRRVSRMNHDRYND